jgi:hypothetical protein
MHYDIGGEEMLACRELAGGGGAGAVAGAGALLCGRRETLSLSLPHFYILKSGNASMNLKEALFYWGKAFSIFKIRGGMYLPGLNDKQVFTFIF